MRILLSIVILFAISLSVYAQEDELKGNWEVIEFNMTNNGESNVKDEAKLEEEGLLWNISLNEDEEFTQTSNMRKGEMETHEGEWEATDDKLTLEFEIDGDDFRITYEYMFEDDVLILMRSNPDATVSVQVTFRKK